MGNVINLFSPGEDINFEQIRGQISEEVYQYLRNVLSGNPGDILRALLMDGEPVGAVRLIYNQKMRVGFIRCLIMWPTNLSNEDHQMFFEAAKESMAKFIRLCFDTYRRLNSIYWNLHPEDDLMHEICRGLTFIEIDSSQAFIEKGIRYRSFFLERLK